MIVVKGSATDVTFDGEISWNTGRMTAFIYVHFYSIPEGRTYHFVYHGHSDKLLNWADIGFIDPKSKKDIELSNPGDSFKVGKISCQRYAKKHKNSETAHHWRIGTDDYCEEIFETEGSPNVVYHQKVRCTVSCSR